MKRKIWKGLHLLKTLFVLSMVMSMTLVQTARAGIVDTGVTTNPCSAGFIDFESETDWQVIASTIPGVQFTTTGGVNWRIGDFDAKNVDGYPKYNGKFPSGSYTSNGTKWAWLGTEQGTGRIDFTGGATYLSLLTSTERSPYTGRGGVALEAYNASDTLIDRAPVTNFTTPNIGTGTMDRLTVRSVYGDISYVIVHDEGNFFLVDDICTDAFGVVNIGVVQIPEFPSILLPVAAALGIMLFMSRRRKG